MKMPSLIFGLCAFAMTFSILLGGATRSGYLSDAVLQVLSLPLLLVSLWRIVDLQSGALGKFRWELVFCGAILLLPLLQLVPLPAFVWSTLPGRGAVASVFDLLGDGMPWMPISVSPEATRLGALSLLPPIAIFLGCVLLGYRERRLMSIFVLSVGLVSVFLGLVQVSQGPTSPLRFFEFTNPTEAVGFFANRNHFAALLYALTLLAAAWAVDSAFNARSAEGRYDPAAVAALVASFTVLVILVAAQGMARSRAGLGLTIIALFGALMLAYSDRRVMPRSGSRSSLGVTPAKLLLGASTLAVVFIVQFTLYRVLDRFTDLVEDSRLAFARNTIEAARANMPFGSGIGTFVPVYAMYEKYQDVLANTYANHAHNDFLELWLETGVVGGALIVLFVIWLLSKCLKVWRPLPREQFEIDHSLSRAATVIIGLIMVHSFFDYPLRTDAMMAVLAFACALLIDPPIKAATEPEAKASNPRDRMIASLHQFARPAHAKSPDRAAPAATPYRQPIYPLGDGVDWPEEWRKPAKRVSPDMGGGRPVPGKGD